MLPLWSLVLGWLLTTVAVLGNGVVIYLIATRRNLRTKTNCFVFSLAVADLGVGAIYFPRFGSACWLGSNCTSTVITVTYPLGAFFNYASVCSLCALTLDRYLAIVQPLRYTSFMTKACVARLILAAWGVGSTVLVYSTKLLLTPPGKTRQILVNYVSYVFVAVSVCACVFLFVATMRMFLIARKHSKENAAIIAQLNYNYTSGQRKVSRPHEATASRMICAVVAVFLVCYSLDIIGIFWVERPGTFYIVKALFVIMNAAANPLVYAVLKREIRRELRQICGLGKQQRLSTLRIRNRSSHSTDTENNTRESEHHATNATHDA